ncbi:MAG: ribonuclease III [Pyrinomonadaceae bacterium]|nr:ribonuclease III [Pyrinomonadaceae bacterium]
MKTTAQSHQDIKELEKVLSYKFTDRALLERATTHRSWAHEQTGPGEEEAARRLHNESFEFIGDSVLGLLVADYLFNEHENLTEGELSRMKHRLVSTATLCKAAKRLDLGAYLRVGCGEEKSGGRRKQALLADAFEAVLAAIYLDGGIDAAREYVQRTLAEELEAADPESAAAADHKTAFQELLQASGCAAPNYIVIETQGPPHRRTFHVEACWDGGRIRGCGRSIKAAEIEAARMALEHLRNSLPETADDASLKLPLRVESLEV